MDKQGRQFRARVCETDVDRESEREGQRGKRERGHEEQEFRIQQLPLFAFKLS